MTEPMSDGYLCTIMDNFDGAHLPPEDFDALCDEIRRLQTENGRLRKVIADAAPDCMVYGEYIVMYRQNMATVTIAGEPFDYLHTAETMPDAMLWVLAQEESNAE